MASPSPKRRKTAPDAPAAPAGDFRPRNQLRRTPPRRASYLSPTKASLARFNPDLLSRPTSAGFETARPTGPGYPTGRGQRALAYVLGASQEQPDSQVEDANHETEDQDMEPQEPTQRVLGDATADQLAQETAEAAGRGEVEPVDSEEDLPIYPTGSQNVEPDLPPQEVLFSSPKKGPRRNKSLGQRLSSPLKLRESPRRKEPEVREAPAGVERSSSVHMRDTPIRIQQSESGQKDREPKYDMSVEATSDLKQQEKARLQQQLQELHGEISKYERAVKRSRSASGDNDPVEHFSDLISLINKANPSPPVSQPEPPPLSTLLSSFLPLAKPVHPPTPPPGELEKPLPTHEPIDLEDPLPFLRLFTSFSYTSSIDIQKLGHQVHSIGMSAPSSLFRVDFNMAIDTVSQCVARLDIWSLSPWASHELGAWITQRAVEKDVGAVCWAVGSYWDLAVKRAKCWTLCRREFGHLLDEHQSGKMARSSGKGTSQRKSARRAESGGQETPASTNVQEDDDEEVSGIGTDLATRDQAEHPIRREELMCGLGRDCIVLRSKEVLLEITWKIQFDWTGEAESVVMAEVALPAVWREADERDSLKKIPAAFGKLVAEMGVFEASKIMVGLLFA